MNRNTILLTVLLIGWLFSIAHVAYYYPQLPDTVASHFNARGEADATTSKTAHTALMISLQTGLVVMFLGFTFGLRHLPPTLINLPHKEYWLAPERRGRTYERMGCSLLMIAIGTQIFFVAINQIVTLYNLGVPATQWFWVVFGIYMVFVIGYCIWLFISFRVPASEKVVPKSMIGDGRSDPTI